MLVNEWLFRKRNYLLMTYIGIATFLIGSTFAMLIKPGYSFTDQWLSDLGTGRYAPVFNITLVLTGLFTSSFYPITFYLLRQKGYSKTRSMIGMLLGATSFIFLILVGIFSLENDFNNLHGISAMVFLISASFAQLLLLSGFSWFVCFNVASASAMDNKLSYISLIMVIIFGFVFIQGIKFEQFILQKLTIYLLIITVLYQSIKIWQTDELVSSS
ncbi:MAG: DUF998 domain-containing protein [Candidatus Heimdallarchaeota archaeon]